jgi:hypothetical protein
MVKEHGSSCGFDIVWSDFQGLSLIGFQCSVFRITRKAYKPLKLSENTSKN